MGQRILIVEDEKNIVDILSFNLVKEGYETLEAYDGEMGLDLALTHNPDLILLDLMLPKLDGFAVCNTLRDKGITIPIIMLTAREEEADKVLGLEVGADDYITKPFSMRELMARVKANIRRTQMLTQSPSTEAPQGEILDLGRISLNLSSTMAYKDGALVELSQREFELLKFLGTQKGNVFSREALMEHVWNYVGYVGDVRGVDVAVRRLREKIEDDPASPRFIVTRRGLGYFFQP